jgi:hypothetical protein
MEGSDMRQRNLRILFSFLLFVLLVVGCSAQKQKDSVPKPSDESVKLPFTEEWLYSLVWIGLYSGEENLFDYPAYAKEENKYMLTLEEEELIGAWNPIPEDRGAKTPMGEKKAPTFLFWPDHSFGASNITPGYAQGIWRIENGIVKAKIYGFRYATRGKGYVIKLVKPYDIDIVAMNDISTKGYSLKPFTRFAIPKEMEGLLNPDSVKDEAFYFKTIASWSAAYGTEYYSITPKYRDAGLTLEQVLTLSVPGADKYW